RCQLTFDYLGSLAPDPSKGKPHHRAQVLSFASLQGWSVDLTAPWVDAVQAEIHDGIGPYALGQITYGLLLNGVPTSSLAPHLDRMADYLDRTAISTAAFLDHASSLRALAAAGTHGDVVDSTIDALF